MHAGDLNYDLILKCGVTLKMTAKISYEHLLYSKLKMEIVCSTETPVAIYQNELHSVIT
jgi:hypothetical protein